MIKTKNRFIAGLLATVMTISSLQTAYAAEDIVLEENAEDTDEVTEDTSEEISSDTEITEDESTEIPEGTTDSEDVESSDDGITGTDESSDLGSDLSSDLNDNETTLYYFDTEGLFTAEVSYTEGFETGSSVRFDTIKDESLLDSYLSLIKEDNDLENIEISGISMDMKSYDENMNETDLPGTVDIKIKPTDMSGYADMSLYHMDNEGKWIESDFIIDDDSLSFKLDTCSPLIWVTETTEIEAESDETEEIEAESDETEEIEEDIEAADKTEGVAFDQTQNVNGVNIHVTAPAGVFPEGSTMTASEIQDADTQTKLEESIDEPENVNTAKSYMYDITIYDKDGNEIEPDTSKGDVDVSFDMVELKDTNMDAAVYHIDDDYNTTQLANENGYLRTIDADSNESKIDEDGEITVQTDGFSFYVVTFTYNSKSYGLLAGQSYSADTIAAGVGLSGTINSITKESTTDVVVYQDGSTWNIAAESGSEATTALTFNMTNNGTTADYVVNITISNSASVYGVIFKNKTLVFVNAAVSDKNYLQTTYGEVESIFAVTNSSVTASQIRSNGVKKVTYDSYYGNVKFDFTSADGMFSGCSSLQEIDLNGMDLSYLTSAQAMFYNCSSLKSVNLKNTTWGSVDMTAMFSSCSLLKTINFSGTDLSKVTYMQSTFDDCTSLTSIKWKNMDLSSCTSFTGLFYGCTNLKSVDFSGTTFGRPVFPGMFQNCSSLETVNFAGCNFSDISSTTEFGSFCFPISLKSMNFSGCDLSWLTGLVYNGGNNLTSINFAGCNLKNVTTLSFNGCPYLNNINFSGCNLSGLTSFYQNSRYAFTFSTRHGTRTIDFSGANLSSLTNLSNFMIAGYNTFDLISFKNCNLKNVTYMNDLFGDTGAEIKKLDFSGSDLSNVKSMTYLVSKNNYENTYVSDTISFLDCDLSSCENFNSAFKNQTNVKEINFMKADLSLASDMSYMFYNCVCLQNCIMPEASKCNYFSNLRNTSYMFYYAGYEGSSLHLENWDMSGVTISKMTCMFERSGFSNLFLNGWKLYGDGSLASFYQETLNYLRYSCKIYMNGWQIGSSSKPITNMNNFFAANTNTKIDIDYTNWTIYCNSNLSMKGFCQSSKFTSFDISSWNFIYSSSSITYDITGMFDSCTDIKNVNLSSLKTGSISNASQMFYHCYSIESIDLDYLDMSNATSLQKMFCDASRLKSIKCSSWDTSNVTSMNQMFSGCKKLRSVDISGWDTSKVTDMDQMFSTSNVMKLKLGENFVFDKTHSNPLTQDESGNVYEQWKKVLTDNTSNTIATTIDLYNDYDGSKNSGTYIVSGYTKTVDSGDYDEVTYDKSTNTLTLASVAKDGETPVDMTLSELYASKLKISSAVMDTLSELKTSTNNDFDSTSMKLNVISKSYVDIMDCSTESKVLWTFDVPKENEAVMTMTIKDRNTGDIKYYIKNSISALNTFNLYDADMNLIETLKADNHHTYADLGYTVEAHTYKDSSGKTQYTYYKCYGDIELYKDADQYGYSSSSKLLSDYIYPEYSEYITYDSTKNNYEVPMEPGKYEVELSTDALTGINLTPDEIITHDETTTVTKDDGTTEDVTTTINDYYIYDTDINIAENQYEASLSLFNYIIKKDVTIRSGVSYNNYNFVYKKSSDDNKTLAGAKFKVTDITTGNIYTYTSDTTGKIFSGTDGHTYTIQEIEAPEGYWLNSTIYTYICRNSSDYYESYSYSAVTYKDGVSVTSSDKSDKCNTCMESGSGTDTCLCKTFGSCHCKCCGTKEYVEGSTDEDFLYIYNSPKMPLKVSKAADSSLSSYDKQNLNFTFYITDISKDSYGLVTKQTIKVGESFTLDNSYFKNGHEYEIEEYLVTDNNNKMEEHHYVKNYETNSMGSYEWMSTMSQDTSYSNYTGDVTYQNNIATIDFVYNSDEDLPSFTFVNHHNVQKHSISVSKKVNTSDGRTDSNEYTFTMNLQNETVDSISGITYSKTSDGTTTTGDVTLDSSGNYTFTLKDGDTIKFLNVPDYTDYKFTESKSDKCTVKFTGATGTLKKSNATVSFTNFKYLSLPNLGGYGNTLPYIFLFALTLTFVGVGRKVKRRK